MLFVKKICRRVFSANLVKIASLGQEICHCTSPRVARWRGCANPRGLFFLKDLAVIDTWSSNFVGMSQRIEARQILLQQAEALCRIDQMVGNHMDHAVGAVGMA